MHTQEEQNYYNTEKAMAENKETWTKQQEWIILNLISLMENQKSELQILTRRVTELELKNLSYVKHAVEEKDATPF